MQLLLSHGHTGKPVSAARHSPAWTYGVKTGRVRLASTHQRSAKIRCNAAITSADGHVALLQGLGSVGEVDTPLVPWLLRLSHIRACWEGGDSNDSLRVNARGVLVWKAALARGLLPDDVTLEQLRSERGSDLTALTVQELSWPEEPLRGVLIRELSKLGVSRFTAKYPAVLTALLRGVLELVCKYEKSIAGVAEEEESERATTWDGNRYMTVQELEEMNRKSREARNGTAPVAAEATPAVAEEDDLPDEQEVWSAERIAAEKLVAETVELWRAPMETLSRAGRAFDGLEALLGGAGFSLDTALWRRKGWAEMDGLRRKLEELKELRDLVRSLGRGGGWGPLRRAPQQHLDMRGRPGLLRTVLEQQETRGLTRSDDISRLLPSEAATLARGREVRQAKLLFYARLAEKALQTYERDGWGEFPTRINPERREIRPTADRGPILLCVDTSGSMRGPREVVAKALALECMRAAKAQERGCYVFAFAGPKEVREVELNNDMKSVNNLLDFLEAVFNGGSDFNEPLKRCLDRLHEAKWANSDILLVSDGELRQPGQEVMRKLAGAKDKLGLRVHSLIVGSPEKKRADPAVLRALCSHILPNGKLETLVSEFGGWASVAADSSMAYDWDDIAGDTRRREKNLRLEALRKSVSKRIKVERKKAAKEAPKQTLYQGGRRRRVSLPVTS